MCPIRGKSGYRFLRFWPQNAPRVNPNESYSVGSNSSIRGRYAFRIRKIGPLTRSNTMKKALAVLVLVLIAAAAQAQTSAPAALEALRPFVKTWKGEFANSTPDKPLFNVERWEYALNNQAIRITHSVNEGTYGGETIVYVDKAQNQLVYFYFTTAGFMTSGTMNVENGKRFTALEKVYGNEGGVTEVKSTVELLPDGRMKTSSQYLKDGSWTDGHAITYSEAPDAKVILP